MLLNVLIPEDELRGMCSTITNKNNNIKLLTIKMKLITIVNSQSRDFIQT